MKSAETILTINLYITILLAVVGFFRTYSMLESSNLLSLSTLIGAIFGTFILPIIIFLIRYFVRKKLTNDNK